MGRSHIMAAALIAAIAVTSVYSLSLPSLSRKGAIDSATVEPTSPTTAGPVTLHVSVAGPLLLDRFDIRQIGKTLTIRVYWKELSEAGAGPTEETIPLGILSEGRHRVLLQSYCENRLGGTAQLSFEVTAASSSGVLETLDDVWVTPADPTTSDFATVHVSGHWPTAGFARTVTLTRLNGHTFNADLYWTSPEDGAAYVVTPYDYEAGFRPVFAGTYAVQVRIFLDGVLVDSASLNFDVIPDADEDTGWPWNFAF